ncbi:MAG: serine hydrolase domain-containing protein, partial [Syntrophothermus sp.]
VIPGIYDSVPSEGFPIKVAEKMFIRKDYEDSVFSWIIHSPLRATNEYKYSDLGFYLLAKAVEEITGQDFSRFLDSTFYQPLGLKTTEFRPLERFPVYRIIPTENDQLFRKQLLRGYVHDPGAAMLGGVAGHAGLFSDATDIGVILQMLMNGGFYGGRQYLLPSTIKEFTRAQFPQNNNRRAMGFDRQLQVPDANGPVCESASPQSYGHSGFTGTYFWSDPTNGLVYIFLSNRVNPDASNQKLSDLNIRTKIHQAMYDILKTVRTD